MSDVEQEIRALHDAGDLHTAATRALEVYGGELYAFLAATMRDDGAAAEAFSMLGEHMWKGLPSFAWQSSLRTWLYVIARRAAAAYFRKPAHRRNKHIGLSAVSDVVDRVRTATEAHLRTEVKDAIRQLRASLDPEEQTLLILRVDRKLSWSEIAVVMCDDGADMKREAARLRKRFQLIKDRLRKRAIEAGIV